jgi:hypothetical protein
MLAEEIVRNRRLATRIIWPRAAKPFNSMKSFYSGSTNPERNPTKQHEGAGNLSGDGRRRPNRNSYGDRYNRPDASTVSAPTRRSGIAVMKFLGP